MCGIYGMFDPSRPLSESARVWSNQARELLKHRGPDGAASVERLDGHCLLGHTRLAIIDLEGGAQPLSNEDGTVWVVCNGEIYNYVELRQDLISKGHRFRTQSDTEVLVHLYEDKGDALLEDLAGMYAFAILDERKRRLLIARDRFGEKPLYWVTLPGGAGIAFASEMKALMSLKDIDRRLDLAALAQFLAIHCIPAPRTHLQGVRKLRAGEAMSVGYCRIRCWRYWQPDMSLKGKGPLPSREEAVEEVRMRVRESVRLRLRSDVPVGAFLSGGVDSTSIVCAIREILPGAKFSTFCASFEDERLDEAPYARVVAEHVHSDHYEIRFSSGELMSVFDKLIDHYDEPFADASMFPTFAVCQAARQSCKVMLSGDGGDELFAGYREHFQYYRWHPVRRFPGVNETAQTLKKFWRENRRGTGLLTFLSSSDWSLLHPQNRSAEILNYFRREHVDAARIGLEELENTASSHGRLPYPISAIEATLTGYLPEQILVKVDRASMRVGLESRAPFLDQSLMEFAAGLPQDYHFTRGLGKALLRQTLPDWVPAHIRWREKQGFTPPLARWLRSSLRKPMEEAVENLPAELQGMLQPDPARRLFREHLAGADRSDQLFRWLVLTRRCRDASWS